MKLLNMSDFEFQLNYIRQNAERLIACQDMNPASPSYGCFHLAYWRDKTSEFADARFQEAAATLGLLALPQLNMSELGFSSDQLLKHFEAGLIFWSKIQHADGSFDEWYKNEHGFAATEFTLIAFGLAMNRLKNSIPIQTFEVYKNVSERACAWLAKRNDLVKYNHQMAAAAALAITAKNLNKAEFFQSAKLKHDSVLKTQNTEGWFVEISGMDLGYCSVLLDYAMLYSHYSADNSGLPAMKSVMNFIDNLVLPNYTILAEMGLCLNPYVSRLGIVLLSKHDTTAAGWRNFLNSSSNAFLGISSYLGDELRICRWSHLPILAYLLNKEEVAPKFNQSGKPEGSKYFKKSNVLVHRNPNYSAFVSIVGGGILKIIDSNVLKQYSTFEDHGYILELDKKKYSTLGYNPQRQTQIAGNEVEIFLQFGPANFMFPGFLSRLILRVLGTIPGFPKYLRKAIDLYRKLNNTALNQSAAPVAPKNSVLTVKRIFSFHKDFIKIEDTFMKSNLGISFNRCKLTLHTRHDGVSQYDDIALLSLAQSRAIKTVRKIKFQDSNSTKNHFELLNLEI